MTEVIIKGTIIFDEDCNFEQSDKFLEDFENFLTDKKVEFHGSVKSYQFNEKNLNQYDSENNKCSHL